MGPEDPSNRKKIPIIFFKGKIGIFLITYGEVVKNGYFMVRLTVNVDPPSTHLTVSVS